MLNFIIKFVVLLSSLPVVKKLLHLYQLKDYNNTRYLKSIFFIFISIALASVSTIFHILEYNIFMIVSILNVLHNFALFFVLPKSKKTPLKYTNKAKRILVLQLLICFISIFFVYSFITFGTIVILSSILAKEINFYDKVKNRGFIHQAQNKLRSMNTKIIAITGSNGKTSVKNILTDFLNIKYKAICTPASFNTPLGIAKFINNLNEKVDIIILEFGARKAGDIMKLCKLFSPEYGIITMVGNQHLATFKSYKNILKTKAELSRFLGNKPCVYNLDNLGTNVMFHEKFGEKYGVSLHQNTSIIYADNIRIKNGITCFDLTSNETHHCETKLLGKHNITNILLCFAMAKRFNIDENMILEKIAKLTPTPHRLELIKTDIYILDDTYNCSLSSATASLEVLSKMPNKKMVVTPGIIEGGLHEKQINQTLGKMMASFDYIVIVGKHNKENLMTGLKQANCNKKILFAPTIDDAKQYFGYLNKNDTLLLLNDLPDDYN